MVSLNTPNGRGGIYRVHCLSPIGVERFLDVQATGKADASAYGVRWLKGKYGGGQVTDVYWLRKSRLYLP